MGLDISGSYRYPGSDQKWLALHQEEILEPELSIIDAHHHLWEEPENHYLLDDLIADLDAGHNIVATVFAQCHWSYRDSGPEHLRPVGETEQVEIVRREALVRRPEVRICAGIVGFANLLDGDRVDEVLDAHIAAAPDHFRGVRQSVARDSHFPDGIVLRPAPAGMMSDRQFQLGVRRLASRGLTFDAMLYHEQIPELTALARKIEGTEIILDHFGCPLGVGFYHDRKREIFDAWRQDIVALAQCPNVRIKLGISRPLLQRRKSLLWHGGRILTFAWRHLARNGACSRVIFR
jgi:L-fuconolactonase